MIKQNEYGYVIETRGQDQKKRPVMIVSTEDKAWRMKVRPEYTHENMTYRPIKDEAEKRRSETQIEELSQRIAPTILAQRRFESKIGMNYGFGK